MKKLIFLLAFIPIGLCAQPPDWNITWTVNRSVTDTLFVNSLYNWTGYRLATSWEADSLSDSLKIEFGGSNILLSGALSTHDAKYVFNPLNSTDYTGLPGYISINDTTITESDTTISIGYYLNFPWLYNTLEVKITLTADTSFTIKGYIHPIMVR